MTGDDPHVIAVVQARMGSTRLPGKVLNGLGGKSVLQWVVERTKRASRVAEVVVATSELAEDDVIAHEAERLGAPVVRGDALDVLSRFAKAVREHGREHVVRITADCPCVDPTIVDRLVAAHLSQGADYTSNTHPRSFPHGLDAEVVTSEALLVADREARAPAEREHVLPFIWRRPERFRLVNVEAEAGERMPELRITLDTPDDLRMLKILFDHLPPAFDLDDILATVRRHPGLGVL